MPKYPKGQLGSLPAVAAESVAETLLAEATTAQTRLEAESDEEALHDFRVALRRLRSVLRAFWPAVDHQVTKKLRRRLRDLAQETNAARDTEVHILWILSRMERLTPTEQVGARWFLKQLDDELAEEYRMSRRTIERSFPKLERQIRKSLRAAALDPYGGSDPLVSFAVGLEGLIADHLETFRQQIEGLQSPAEEDAAHATRIGAKRLRYLLELIEREVKPARPSVRYLKELQDILGELHDAQVVAAEFGTACERAAAEHARRLSDLSARRQRDDRERRRIRRRNATPGMLALIRLCRDAHDELFAQVVRWRESKLPKVIQATEHVLAELRTHAPQDLEVERKYLLTGPPDAVTTAESEEIDQGWLPGERLKERIRRVAGKDGMRYYRTIKAGAGVTRIEVDEETTPEVFDQLWPLTEGRRVQKRRYYVADGDVTWEIDEFLDRPLWLAEVELPAPRASVFVPEWLVPTIEREVTGEAEYVNVNLAR